MSGPDIEKQKVELMQRARNYSKMPFTPRLIQSPDIFDPEDLPEETIYSKKLVRKAPRAPERNPLEKQKEDLARNIRNIADDLLLDAGDTNTLRLIINTLNNKDLIKTKDEFLKIAQDAENALKTAQEKNQNKFSSYSVRGVEEFKNKLNEFTSAPKSAEKAKNFLAENAKILDFVRKKSSKPFRSNSAASARETVSELKNFLDNPENIRTLSTRSSSLDEALEEGNEHLETALNSAKQMLLNKYKKAGASDNFIRAYERTFNTLRPEEKRNIFKNGTDQVLNNLIRAGNFDDGQPLAADSAKIVNFKNVDKTFKKEIQDTLAGKKLEYPRSLKELEDALKIGMPVSMADLSEEEKRKLAEAGADFEYITDVVKRKKTDITPRQLETIEGYKKAKRKHQDNLEDYIKYLQGDNKDQSNEILQNLKDSKIDYHDLENIVRNLTDQDTMDREYNGIRGRYQDQANRISKVGREKRVNNLLNQVLPNMHLSHMKMGNRASSTQDKHKKDILTQINKELELEDQKLKNDYFQKAQAEIQNLRQNRLSGVETVKNLRSGHVKENIDIQKEIGNELKQQALREAQINQALGTNASKLREESSEILKTRALQEAIQRDYEKDQIGFEANILNAIPNQPTWANEFLLYDKFKPSSADTMQEGLNALIKQQALNQAQQANRAKGGILKYKKYKGGGMARSDHQQDYAELERKIDELSQKHDLKDQLPLATASDIIDRMYSTRKKIAPANVLEKFVALKNYNKGMDVDKLKMKKGILDSRIHQDNIVAETEYRKMQDQINNHLKASMLSSRRSGGSSLSTKGQLSEKDYLKIKRETTSDIQILKNNITTTKSIVKEAEKLKQLVEKWKKNKFNPVNILYNKDGASEGQSGIWHDIHQSIGKLKSQEGQDDINTFAKHASILVADKLIHSKGSLGRVTNAFLEVLKRGKPAPHLSYETNIDILNDIIASGQSALEEMYEQMHEYEITKQEVQELKPERLKQPHQAEDDSQVSEQDTGEDIPVSDKGEDEKIAHQEIKNNPLRGLL